MHRRLRPKPPKPTKPTSSPSWLVVWLLSITIGMLGMYVILYT